MKNIYRKKTHKQTSKQAVILCGSIVSFRRRKESQSQVSLSLRTCLHEGGGLQVGEVTRGGSPHLTGKHDQIKMRDYMDRPVTSPIWGPPAPCKQALTYGSSKGKKVSIFISEDDETNGCSS